jgi:uncharacterized protein
MGSSSLRFGSAPALRALAALLALFALIAFGAVGRARAQDVLPVPPLEGRVIDRTDTLNAQQRQAMEQHLANVERELGTQIVVLIVPSTAPEDIAAFAQRVGDQWKIGRREVGDGLIIVVAKNDRRIRIEVAKALEGAVPDLAARQIITETITPAFRRNDYAGGLNAAIDRIGARIKPEGLPAPQETRRAPSRAIDSFDWGELAIFFFFAVPIAGAMLSRIFGRKLGALATGGAAGGVAWLLGASVLVIVLAALFTLLMVGVFGVGSLARGRSGPASWGGWSGGGGGWSGGGGGGSGGFSSGGGGDFGGGGASGDW